MSVSAGVNLDALDKNITPKRSDDEGSDVVDAALAASCLFASEVGAPASEQLWSSESDISSKFRTFWRSVRNGNSDRMLKDLELITEAIDDYKAALTVGIPQLPEIEGDYQRYPQSVDLDPYDWLAEHWGQWLRHFNPELERDHLFLDQLGKLDPALKQSLYAKRRGILTRTGRKISEIVPTKSVRLDFELAGVDQQSLRDAMRLYVAPRSRKSRKNKV